jgi:hypothetical protein
MAERKEAGPQVWQRPEHLWQPEALESILIAASGCRPGFLRMDRGYSYSRQVAQLHVVRVQRVPMQGGVSGAHLERGLIEVVVEQGGVSRRETLSLVLKRMRPDESWLMRSSGDLSCREVQLWRYGLLADAPRVLCAPVLAAAYDAETREGALLLADARRWLGTLQDCQAPVQPGQVRQYLDHLARLHAHYWQDGRLGDEQFALASVGQTLLMLAPSVIEAELSAGNPHPYLPVSHVGWKAFFEQSPPDALRKIQRVFDAPAAFLASAAGVPATLLHGDAWPPNMGALPGRRMWDDGYEADRTILIDWALATAGPASFDPFWLLFAWQRVDTRQALLFYRARLAAHLARRGRALSASLWYLLLDLGVVRTVMTCGESMGQRVLFAGNEAQRAQAISALSWWTHWAASAIERRGWDR